MSYSKQKCIPLLCKRDCNPFLDTALEFLFAIVEGEVQKKEPAYISPSVHEFYTFSGRVSQSFQTKKKQKSRKSNRLSPALHTFFHRSLGTKLVSGLNRSKQGFHACFSTILLAIMGYSEFLNCMDICTPGELNGRMQNAISWYFSHYFLISKHHYREKTVQLIYTEVIKKRYTILKEFLHVKPSFQNVQPCLEGMQNYFLSESFQTIVQELYKNLAV